MPLGDIRNISFRWHQDARVLDIGSWDILGLRHPQLYIQRITVVSGEEQHTYVSTIHLHPTPPTLSVWMLTTVRFLSLSLSQRLSCTDTQIHSLIFAHSYAHTFFLKNHTRTHRMHTFTCTHINTQYIFNVESSSVFNIESKVIFRSGEHVFVVLMSPSVSSLILFNAIVF